MPAVRWPTQPAEFQKEWLAYYKHMEQLAAHLLSLAALALELPPQWFAGKIDRHRSALRALNYPKLDKPLAAGEVRAGAHTDYGSLTILLQDSVGGLQVRNRAKAWVDATPRPNSFVINLGDLMARWTNDRWVSTLHRVVQPPSAAASPPARRQSIAFFHNVNADAQVEAIPTCVDHTNPPKYPAIRAWDFLMSKHSAATSY
jgi:isopenicillin N synthase-like dioxygenase